MNNASSKKPVSGNYTNKSVFDKITARYLPREELHDDYYFCRRLISFVFTPQMDQLLMAMGMEQWLER
jgi:hypothetical protein